MHSRGINTPVIQRDRHTRLYCMFNPWTACLQCTELISTWWQRLMDVIRPKCSTAGPGRRLCFREWTHGEPFVVCTAKPARHLLCSGNHHAQSNDFLILCSAGKTQTWNCSPDDDVVDIYTPCKRSAEQRTISVFYFEFSFLVIDHVEKSIHPLWCSDILNQCSH